MPDRKTIEVLLTGRNRLSPVLQGAGNAVRTFADGTVGHFRRIGGAVLNLRNTIAVLGAGMAARLVLKPAIEMEDFVAQYRTLTGSLDAAREKLRLLSAFSEDTPFEPEAVFQAARTLDTFTRGAVDTVSVLRLVGDAAEIVGREKFPELASAVGRAYALIQSGQPIESVTRVLTHMGVVTPQVTDQIEKMQKAGADSSLVWSVMVEALRRYEGAMDRSAGTTSRMLADLRKKWSEARQQVGAQILPQLRRALEDLITTIDRLRADGSLARWGADAATAIDGIYTRLKSLAGFLATHGDLLKSVGLTYAGLVLLNSTARAVGTLNLAFYALSKASKDTKKSNDDTTDGLGKTKNAVGLLQTNVLSLKGALLALPLAAASAFEWYQLGKLIQEVIGLCDWVDKLQAKLDRGLGRETRHTGDVPTETQDVVDMVNARDMFLKRGGTPDQFEKYWAAEKVKRLNMRSRSAAAAAAPPAVAKAGPDFPVMEAEERAELARAAALAAASAETQKASDEAMRQAQQLAEERQRILDDLAAMEQERAERRQDEDLADAQAGTRAREEMYRHQADSETRSAEQLADAVSRARDRLLMPTRDRRALDRADRERQRAEAHLERDVSRAREKAADFFGARELSPREKELLAYDRLRRGEKAARARAGTAESAAAAESARASRLSQQEHLLKSARSADLADRERQQAEAKLALLGGLDAGGGIAVPAAGLQAAPPGSSGGTGTGTTPADSKVITLLQGIHDKVNHMAGLTGYG